MTTTSEQLDKILCSLVAFIWISTANYFLLALYDCVFPWIELNVAHAPVCCSWENLPCDRATERLCTYVKRTSTVVWFLFNFGVESFFFQTNSIYKIIHIDRDMAVCALLFYWSIHLTNEVPCKCISI